jgi:hypothetical protein
MTRLSHHRIVSLTSVACFSPAGTHRSAIHALARTASSPLPRIFSVSPVRLADQRRTLHTTPLPASSLTTVRTDPDRLIMTAADIIAKVPAAFEKARASGDLLFYPSTTQTYEDPSGLTVRPAGLHLQIFIAHSPLHAPCYPIYTLPDAM